MNTMNGIKSITDLLGQTDIYLIDQLMKGRYKQEDKILDAGCGNGRNMHWFILNQMDINGVDQDQGCINFLKIRHPEYETRLTQAAVSAVPYETGYFDHVISSAVLHFAVSKAHFIEMFSEMLRVLRPGGTLFIRMTSDIGIENQINLIAEGVYHLPDGSNRFLLNRELLSELIETFQISLLEPLKTVNVNDQRCMSTLLFQKNR